MSAPTVLDTSQKVFDLFRVLVHKQQEEVWAAALNPQLELIDYQLIFRGTVDACAIHPRDLFRFLIVKNASSFILVHNHPTGDPRPSLYDIQVTQKISRAADLIEISLIDHVIIGTTEHFSFADRGLRVQRKMKPRSSGKRRRETAQAVLRLLEH